MARKLIETGNLSSQLSIKDDAEVMLKTNINIKDWLVNGLTTILHIFWKDGLSKNCHSNMIFFVISGKIVFLFSRKYDIFSLDGK